MPAPILLLAPIASFLTEELAGEVLFESLFPDTQEGQTLRRAVEDPASQEHDDLNAEIVAGGGALTAALGINIKSRENQRLTNALLKVQGIQPKFKKMDDLEMTEAIESILRDQGVDDDEIADLIISRETSIKDLGDIKTIEKDLTKELRKNTSPEESIRISNLLRQSAEKKSTHADIIQGAEGKINDFLETPTEKVPELFPDTDIPTDLKDVQTDTARRVKANMGARQKAAADAASASVDPSKLDPSKVFGNAKPEIPEQSFSKILLKKLGGAKGIAKKSAVGAMALGGIQLIRNSLDTKDDIKEQVEAKRTEVLPQMVTPEQVTTPVPSNPSEITETGLINQQERNEAEISKQLAAELLRRRRAR